MSLAQTASSQNVSVSTFKYLNDFDGLATYLFSYRLAEF